MTVKEKIEAEIETMGNAELEELYELIKHFSQRHRTGERSSLMAKLKKIEIDAPEDFAANHDKYVQGGEVGR